MLNWVGIVRRMVKLYGVHSAQELGMALGIPFHFGEDGHGADEEIPWMVLDMVVADKGVSWDWLLTGRNFSPEPQPPSRQLELEKDEAPIIQRGHTRKQAAPIAVKTPHIETRQLARTLLTPGGDNTAESFSERMPEDRPKETWIIPPESAETANEKRDESVVRELEEIKASMQRELSRVDEILRKQRGE